MIPIKQQALEWIRTLPDDCTLEDIQDHLSFRKAVERGLKDMEEGNVISHEEVKRRVGEWLASYGQAQARQP
jgi:predicted transcriptional regulator